MKKRKNKKKRRKSKVKKTRNWHALNAILRKAGAMKDKKKQDSKFKCRKVNEDND